MELGKTSRDSTGFGEMEGGLISRGGRNLRVLLLTSWRPDVPRIWTSQGPASPHTLRVPSKEEQAEGSWADIGGRSLAIHGHQVWVADTASASLLVT